MKNFFLQLKEKLSSHGGDDNEEPFDEYVEVDHNKEAKSKVLVRPYTMEEFER